MKTIFGKKTHEALAEGIEKQYDRS
jgi:hypothetical protein